MNAPTKLRMDADEFIAWAVNLPKGERYELVAGEVVPMAAEPAGHFRTKQRAWLALNDAMRESSVSGEVLGDGIAVRIDGRTVYEPDCLVRLGPLVDDETVEISDPTILVEVTSPSTYRLDSGAKLQDYFRLESVRHYLILDGRSGTVTHHARRADGGVQTSFMREGVLRLEPPGLTLPVARFFSDRG